MVFDKIDNWSLYTGLGKRIASGLKLLKSGKLDKFPPGKHAIDGDRLYASVQEYRGKAPKDGKWEAHRKYIDIQYMVSGSEIMGCCPVVTLKVLTKYNRKNDVEFFKGGLEKGIALKADTKMFAIFYPGDAHMPMLASRPKGPVKKIVLKVLSE